MLARETEQRKETSNDDWLKAVYTMGVILISAPFLLWFLRVFATVLIPGLPGFSGIPAEHLFGFTGVVAIGYAAIKLRTKHPRFQPSILVVEVIR